MIIITYYIAIFALVKRALGLLPDEPIAITGAVHNFVRAAAVLDNDIGGGCTEDGQVIVMRLVGSARRQVVFAVVRILMSRQGELPDRILARNALALFLGADKSGQEDGGENAMTAITTSSSMTVVLSLVHTMSLPYFASLVIK